MNDPAQNSALTLTIQIMREGKIRYLGAVCMHVLGCRLPLQVSRLVSPFARSNCQLLGRIVFSEAWRGCHREVPFRLYCDVHILETCNQVFVYMWCCELHSLPFSWNPSAFQTTMRQTLLHEKSWPQWSLWALGPLTFTTNGPQLYGGAH